MSITYTTLLGLAKPVSGTEAGTWGDTVNNNLTDYLDSAVAGAQIISGSLTAVTLSKTTGASLSQAGAGATGSSQYQSIRCTGNPASLLTITVPATDKTYVIINATSTSQSVKIVGAGPTTGVTILSGKTSIVAWNGSDFVEISLLAGITNALNTVLGVSAFNITASGVGNTAVGYQSLLADTTGASNTAIGQQTLSANTTGGNNVALGYQALLANTTGGSNTASGYQVLVANTTGLGNSAFGNSALTSNTTGWNNSAVGYETLISNTTGTGNVAIGSTALTSNTTGSTNMASGYEALYSNTTGSNNIAIGLDALFNNTTGSLNIAIGSEAYTSNSTGIRNVGIGAGCTSSSSGVSNEVNIFNGTVTARFQGSASSWSFVSDIRDKTNIVDLELGLKFINKHQPRKFEWALRHTDVDKGKVASGFIAQEILNVLKQEDALFTGLVDTNDSEKYMLAQTNLIPILVNAVKELSAELAAFKLKVGD